MEVLDQLNWTEPRTVRTKYGERILRKAHTTQEFWALWKKDKANLKKDGYSVVRENDGEWTICHWGKVPTEVLEQREANRELSRATDANLSVDSPKGLEYLPYQKAGIAFALNKTGTLLGDEMGLGKTIETIGVINSSEKQKVLIICPASLRLNWRKELEKWLVLPYTIGVVNRSKYPENVDIVIINYDVVRKHHEVLTSQVWDILIIDEVHYLKHQTAQRTKYIFGAKKTKTGKAAINGIQANKRIYLTGTPITNRPIELYPVLHSLDSKEWPSYWTYAQRYCGATNNGYGWDFNGSSNLEELQDRLRSSLMIRRLKEDVLTELPAKRRQIIEIPPEGDARYLVKAEAEAWEKQETLKANVELAKAGSPEEYAHAVSELRHDFAVYFSELSALRHDTAVAKIPYVLEHLHNIDHKVVVFAHHKDVIYALKEDLGEAAVVLTGDTKMEDREIAVSRFQNDPSVQYFLGNIQAAGVGITLTAASHVVFAELDWVPGNISQAEDRCHRIGQDDAVLVQHLVLEGSLDALMAQTVIGKQRVIDKALDAEYQLNDDDYPTYREIEETAEYMEEDEISIIHAKLQQLALLDSDRATERNGMGFSMVDSNIGHSLAEAPFLTSKQAIIGQHLVHKYRRQLEE